MRLCTTLQSNSGVCVSLWSIFGAFLYAAIAAAVAVMADLYLYVSLSSSLSYFLSFSHFAVLSSLLSVHTLDAHTHTDNCTVSLFSLSHSFARNHVQHFINGCLWSFVWKAKKPIFFKSTNNGHFFIWLEREGTIYIVYARYIKKNFKFAILILIWFQ